MRPIIRTGIFLIVMAGVPAPAQVRQTRTLSGSVIVRGPTVASARITIQTPSRSFHRIIFADGSGNFALGGVPIGQVEIVLEAEGCSTIRDLIDVPPGSGPFDVQYVMNPLPAKTDKVTPGKPGVSVPKLQAPPKAREELEAGMREMKARQVERARKHFETALQLFPKFPEALHAMGLLEAGEQRAESAISYLRRAVEADSSYAEGYVTFARILNSQARSAEAHAAALKGIERQGNLWQAHYELGVASLSLGNLDSALEAANRIEALAGPTTPEARLLRSGVYLKRNQLAEARTELKAFLDLAPNHPFADLARQTLQQLEVKR